MSIESAFQHQGTVNVAASTTSANVQLPSTSNSALGFQSHEGDTVLVFNASGNLAFVEFGSDNTVTASVTASYPVPPNSTRLVGVGPYVKWAAAILASATGTIYFSRGKGHQY